MILVVVVVVVVAVVVDGDLLVLTVASISFHL